MPKSEKTNEKMVPVLYCDIDGTIRWGKDELGRFVNTVEDVRVFDGVADLLWGYKKLGWRIIGVSNQGGIALGHMTTADCVKAMAETQVQTNFAFDKLVWCSHHPEADTREMAVCWCRKPKTGLVIEAALILSDKTDELYPPHLGLFVGDRPEDEECATNAGLRFLDAGSWRAGHHLALLKEGKDFAPPPRSTVAKVNEILRPRPLVNAVMGVVGTSPSERLPDDILQWAIQVTGAKTKTSPVSELEVGADFVHDELLYTVIQKSELLVTTNRVSELKSELTFYDPQLLTEFQMSPGSLPWTTEVITDDK